MYGGILNFLIAIVIQALAPRSAGAGWSGAGLALMAGILAAALLGCRWWFRRRMARALHDGAYARSLRARFSEVVQRQQTLMLVPFALLLYATDYASLVVTPAAGISEVLGSALGICPYLLLLCAVWWEAYPLHGVLLGQSGSRVRFVTAHARMELPVLVPWVVLMALSDGVGLLWPAGMARLQQEPLLQLLYAPLFLVLVGIFLPVLVKAMWGCRPIPAGPLRERLEDLCTRLNLKVGEILYWPILEGRVLTAGIVGLLPRFRYLLITPALAESLPPEELDGVVAHEAGHVRHGHLWFYLFFFLGYVCVLAVFFRFAEAGIAWWGIADPEALRRPRVNLMTSAALTVGLLAVLFAYFRVLFGAVSRAFERQADANALEAIGRAGPLTRALERISDFSGEIRDLPSWHHGSIGERVTFLHQAAADPRLLASQHRRVRLLTLGFAAGVLLMGSLAVGLQTGPLGQNLDRFVAEHGLLARLAREPADVKGRFVLANLYQEWRREADAERTYQEVLRLEPRNPDALNNLAWLYLTAQDPALDRPERALALAELAVALRPAAHILDTLAEARYRVHDAPGAVAAIRAALARGPQNREYYLEQLRRFEAAASSR
jgi:Zn-dependent protease with chaperone function